MLITHRVVLAKRVMRATMPRTLGAFSICTEMSGSGRRTGTELTSSGAQTDPTGAASGSLGFFGVVPGTSTGTSLRSASPHHNAPSYRYDSIGFRVGFKQQ